MSEKLADWTTGAEAIVYQCLRRLRRRAVFPPQLLRRLRRAGSGGESAPAAQGTVYATSLVCRAATPETRAHVPYNIVLVDTVRGLSHDGPWRQ